jgi:hypothetical protein
MARKIKVYWANYNGKNHIMAATTSVSSFLGLVKNHPKLSPIQREYVSETGNESEIQIAMMKPGELFMSNNDKTDWRHI